MFFFNDTATTEIYTLSLHDALPIYFAAPRVDHLDLVLGEGRDVQAPPVLGDRHVVGAEAGDAQLPLEDRKSTRLNSSHANISYAVFCLKKKITSTSLVSHTITLHIA